MSPHWSLHCPRQLLHSEGQIRSLLKHPHELAHHAVVQLRLGWRQLIVVLVRHLRLGCAWKRRADHARIVHLEQLQQRVVVANGCAYPIAMWRAPPLPA
eukprot:9519408-Heterocapsa_arctica.AAC.1